MNTKSKISVFLVVISLLFVFYQNKFWKKNFVINDVVSYYAYLPATFVYHDISLKFIDKDPGYFSNKFWPEKGPNNSKVIKTTMGLSILYAPFFFVGHTIQLLSNANADPFSSYYQIPIIIGVFLYVLLGFLYLRKVLLFFFSDTITSITLLAVFGGTNILWYCTFDGLMAHSFLFTIVNILLYYSIKIHSSFRIKYVVVIGFLLGLATLIRPTMIIWILLPLLFNFNLTTLKSIISHKKISIISLVVFGIAFFLPITPQLFYWKKVTGHWLFFSYGDERFYFNDSHVVELFIGFRKGLFIYFPLLFLACIGLILLTINVKKMRWAISIPLLTTIYALSCWWAWWFGGSFGYRGFVELYGIFSLGLAYLLSLISNKKIVVACLTGMITTFVYYALFESWQFTNNLLHYDSMTKESFLLGFGKTSHSYEWWESLDIPKYKRAKNGLPEYYSSQEIKNIKESDKINFTSLIRNVVCADQSNNNFLLCNRNAFLEWETFSLIYLNDSTIALKSYAGKYISCDANKNYALIADKDSIGECEKFKFNYLGNNIITLKAFNNHYVTNKVDYPFEIFANGNSVNTRSKYRIFINE